ncbi:unnamed protein product [Brassica oleracea]
MLQISVSTAGISISNAFGYFSVGSTSASTTTIQPLPAAIMIITITTLQENSVSMLFSCSARMQTLVTALTSVAGSFLDLLLSGSTIKKFPRLLYRYLLGVLNQ